MAWLTWIGLRTGPEKPEADAREVSTVYGVWVARCSMIAVFSLPLFAAWAISERRSSPHCVRFALALTLIAALLMGIMVFVRQHLLDRELIHLLNHSRESVRQSEAPAGTDPSVGKTGVDRTTGRGRGTRTQQSDHRHAGLFRLASEYAAHPGTTTPRRKIGQYVRRTKSLVASLISFARQAPAPKTPIDLNTLGAHRCQTDAAQWEPLKIEVRTQFDPTAQGFRGCQSTLASMPAVGWKLSAHHDGTGSQDFDRQHGRSRNALSCTADCVEPALSAVIAVQPGLCNRLCRRLGPERVSRHCAGTSRPDIA